MPSDQIIREKLSCCSYFPGSFVEGAVWGGVGSLGMVPSILAAWSHYTDQENDYALHTKILIGVVIAISAGAFKAWRARAALISELKKEQKKLEEDQNRAQDNEKKQLEREERQAARENALIEQNTAIANALQHVSSRLDENTKTAKEAFDAAKSSATAVKEAQAVVDQLKAASQSANREGTQLEVLKKELETKLADASSKAKLARRKAKATVLMGRREDTDFAMKAIERSVKRRSLDGRSADPSPLNVSERKGDARKTATPRGSVVGENNDAQTPVQLMAQSTAAAAVAAAAVVAPVAVSVVAANGLPPIDTRRSRGDGLFTHGRARSGEQKGKANEKYVVVEVGDDRPPIASAFS